MALSFSAHGKVTARGLLSGEWRSTGRLDKAVTVADSLAWGPVTRLKITALPLPSAVQTSSRPPSHSLRA